MLKGAFEERRGRSLASERWGHEQENTDNTFRNGHCGGAAGGCAGARGSCERWFGRQQRRQLFCPRDQQRERAPSPSRSLSPSQASGTVSAAFRLSAACDRCTAAASRGRARTGRSRARARRGGTARLLAGARRARVDRGMLGRSGRCVRTALQKMAAGILGDPPYTRVGGVAT